MKQLVLFLCIAGAVACGSESAPKSNNTNGATNGTTNGATNSQTNNSSATNGGTTTGTTGGSNGSTNGTTNGGTNNATTGVECEILTSDSDETYCNLQATCGDETILAECLFDEVWRCYCGMDSHLYPENPCDDPDFYAPRLAGDCGG